MNNEKQKFIRNFSIISHIDHGKSTLADSLIFATNPSKKVIVNTQLLDNMALEKKHGITIKSNHIVLDYKYTEKNFEMCLIDTPGHVDFAFEVSRSLRACEGVLLVVDATQGIQAQTVSNVNIALEHNLMIIPVINKIDMPNADVSRTVTEIEEYLGLSCVNCPRISAKLMTNIQSVIEKVITTIPAPINRDHLNFQALIFDSFYDTHQGVILYCRITSGLLKKEDELFLQNNNTSFNIVKIMLKKIKLLEIKNAWSGQIVVLLTNLKQHELTFVGDTIVKFDDRKNTGIIPGFVRPKPIIFSNLYLSNNDKFQTLTNALQKLKLNDDSLTYTVQQSSALGMGYLCGFLGSLHRQIIKERLNTEYDIEIIPGMPSVEYSVKLKNKAKQISVFSASKMPSVDQIQEIRALFCKLIVCTPLKYYGEILKYTIANGGTLKDFSKASNYLYYLTFEMALNRMIIDYSENIKSISNGYASITYELIDFRRVNVVKVEFLVNYEEVQPLTIIVDKNDAQKIGKRVCERLKKLIPPGNFQIAIQAVIGGKIIARTTIKALRKNVTEKLYGGDITRKMKLLKKQKAGKKRMKKFGKVFIPSDVFVKINQET